MDPRQFVQGRLVEGRGDDLELGPERAYAFHDGHQPGRLFGMAGTAVVLQEPGRPGHDERRHAGPRH